MENGTVEYYEVGSFSTDITPPLAIPYLAGSPRHQFFTGVHDPLYASAVVLSDGRSEAALITIDGIGIYNGILGRDRSFSDELKEKIERTTGIRKEAVILMSGHIHSTPDTLDFRPLRDYPEAIPWLTRVMEDICHAITCSLQHKFKAQLKIGKGNVEGISMNRRGAECLDTEAIVLLFEALEEEKNIVVVNYACHPVIVQVQEKVSADYIGAMRDLLKNCFKGTRDVLFIQGACGDINPRRGWTCDFRDVYLTGAALAGEVLKVLSLMAAPDYPAEPVSVGSISEVVDLPSRDLPPQPEIEKLNREAAELRMQYEKAQSMDEKERILQKLGPVEEACWRIGEGNSAYKAELQLIKLGTAVVVGIPAEPMCQMGLEIKEMFKPGVSLPAGYANGYLGYLASPADWEKGGYEVELGPWSKVGPDSYAMVLNKIRSLMERIT